MRFAAELEDATRPRTRRCRTAGQGRGRVLTPHTVSAPFTIADDLVHVGVSIGIAFSHGSDAGIAELIREADIALYRAKNDGRGRAQLYDETLIG